MKMVRGVVRSLVLLTGILGILAVAGQVMAAKQAPAQAVDINQASIEQLMTIPGLGATKAKAIVAYRETAPFKTAEELVNVKGIGEKLYAKIQPYVTVSQQGTKPGTAGK